MSGNSAPPAWPGGRAISPAPAEPTSPQHVPVLPPSPIAPPPGVDAALARDRVTVSHELRRRVPRRTDAMRGLGDAFAGSPATTVMRIAAFTLDAAAVALLTAATLLVWHSPLLASLTVFELIVGLWVLEARTGLTFGNALLRLRTARTDRPFSPGVGRQFVRGLITVAGFVVVIGSWVVVASSAWDRRGTGRTWADRAAGTVVVSVPSRREIEAASVPVAPAPAGPLAPPQVVALDSYAGVDDDDSPATESRAGSRRAEAAVDIPASPEHPPFAVAAVSPATGQIATPASESGALLLIFDTGQRVQLELPLAANLGRAPVASSHDDRLVVVEDPDSSVSKTHLRVEHSRGRTWVTDFSSTNGSDIRSDDGETTELVAGERVLLDDGDRVRIGNRSFTINLLLGADGSAGERA